MVCSNPPWSVGQKSANDDAQNESYPCLDAKIENSYAARSDSGLKKGLYDSYVRAFRWGSDRIVKHGDSGIVCFVSNAGWLRSDGGSGIRRTFVKEFSSIYVVDFKGNQNTQGEISRREGGKVFGSGSRVPVAITILVKNPRWSGPGVIHYCAVDDYLTRKQKLDFARAIISHEPEWQILKQDKYGDWLNQRDDSFYELAPLGVTNGNKKTPLGMFALWSLGVSTNRDPWVWNYSAQSAALHSKTLTRNTNAEIARMNGDISGMKFDSKKYSWSAAMKSRAKKGQLVTYAESGVVLGMYRPFVKQYLYFGLDLIERPSLMPLLFPRIKQNTIDINL